jgi:hypothetical protein
MRACHAGSIQPGSSNCVSGGIVPRHSALSGKPGTCWTGPATAGTFSPSWPSMSCLRVTAGNPERSRAQGQQCADAAQAELSHGHDRLPVIAAHPPGCDDREAMPYPEGLVDTLIMGRNPFAHADAPRSKAHPTDGPGGPEGSKPKT